MTRRPTVRTMVDGDGAEHIAVVTAPAWIDITREAFTALMTGSAAGVRTAEPGVIAYGEDGYGLGVVRYRLRPGAEWDTGVGYWPVPAERLGPYPGAELSHGAATAPPVG